MFVIAIYGLLILVIFTISICLRLVLRCSSPETTSWIARNFHLSFFQVFKPFFAKLIPRLFTVAFLILLLAAFQRKSARGHLFFIIGGLIGLSSLYLLAIYSLPNIEINIFTGFEEGKSSTDEKKRHLSNLPQKEKRKLRRIYYLIFVLFYLAVSIALYFSLKSLGASDAEVLVITLIALVGGAISWIIIMWKMGLFMKK